MLGYLQFPNIDPVIFEINGPAALRWYGLTYAIAFGAGYLGLWWLQRSGFARIEKKDVTSYMIAGVLGVFIGGRIGYLLFYQFDALFLGSMPLGERMAMVGRVWEGGMSFHGGALGVILFCGAFARWRKHSLVNILDCTPHWVPFGIFCVRMANFINGELYGRVITDSAGKPVTDGAQLPWYAMKFPTDPEAMWRLRDLGESFNAGNPLPVDPAIWAQVEPFVPGRYPSQLLQAGLEGLAFFVIFWIARRWLMRPGMPAGVALMIYALMRIPVEYVRQPDPQLDPSQSATATATFLASIGLTMGQLLCVLFFLGGATLVALALKTKWFGAPYTPQELRYPFQGTPPAAPEK